MQARGAGRAQTGYGQDKSVRSFVQHSSARLPPGDGTGHSRHTRPAGNEKGREMIPASVSH